MVPEPATESDAQRPRVRPVPLACYDAFDGAHVQVLFAREVVGGNKGQLPGQLELVLVEHEAPAGPDGWHELTIDGGREVMAERFAMVRRASARQA